MQGLPALATSIGGGSAATGYAILAATAASTAAGVSSAVAQQRAGRIAAKEAKTAAAAEGDASRQREIERKRALLRAIGSQQAQAGAAGVSSQEGSPARIAQLDIDQASTDLLVDRATTSQRQNALRSQGRAARFQGRVGAATTLADTAVSATSVLI